MFDIKTEQFEGPLELLVKLIENEKVAITEVSLAHVTDQYLSRLSDLSLYRHVDELADFLVVAAKLLLIKSRKLLPNLSEEEKEEIEDLEKRLKIYQEFYNASKVLEKLYAGNRVSFPRRVRIVQEEVRFSPPHRVSGQMLTDVFSKILAVAQKPLHPVRSMSFDSRISIQDKIFHIKNALAKRIRCSFRQLITDQSSRTELIVSFLALLELVKQRHADVLQEALFQDIQVELKEIEHVAVH